MMNAVTQYMNYYQPVGAADRNETTLSVADDVSGTEKTVRDTTEQVHTLPGQNKTHPGGTPKDALELSQEAETIRQLQLRDREVRAHEAAHAAVGGAYAGSPTYTFKRGPDGQVYASGGEVSIDVSPVSGDPQATMQKAQQVRSAALAPAEPSSQDMKVAQKAQAMAAKARMDMSSQMSEALNSLDSASGGQKDTGSIAEETQTGNATSDDQLVDSPADVVSGIARLSIYS